MLVKIIEQNGSSRTMQCKDIPVLPILSFLAGHGCSGPGTRCNWYFGNENDVHNAMPGGTPNALVLAKMRNLIHRGLVDGCDCGCRGDFELTDKGRTLLKTIYPSPMKADVDRPV